MKCSSSDYANPPPYGTVITARHLGYFKSSQRVKYPSVLRIRYDTIWNENSETEASNIE